MPNKPELTDQQAIHLIDRITGDDWCYDLDSRTIREELTGDLKIAHEKLSLIYRIAHSMNRSATCHHAHQAWRKEASELFSASPDE